LAADPNPSSSCQPVTVTAWVTASGSPVTAGNVQFLEGANPISPPLGLVSSGAAILNYPNFPVGTNIVTAKYLGSPGYSGSTSNAVSIVVNFAVASTALATSPNPSTPGQPVTMIATVTSSGTCAMPSGVVQYFDGASLIDAVVLSASGVAVLKDTQLTQGAHALTAKYAGNPVYAPSTSNVVSQIVN
jgi:hypothetical protein